MFSVQSPPKPTSTRTTNFKIHSAQRYYYQHFQQTRTFLQSVTYSIPCRTPAFSEDHHSYSDGPRPASKYPRAPKSYIEYYPTMSLVTVRRIGIKAEQLLLSSATSDPYSDSPEFRSHSCLTSDRTKLVPLYKFGQKPPLKPVRAFH